MGLNLIALKKPIGVMGYDVFNDEKLEMADFGPDERLLTIMSETGTEKDVFISFSETQLEKLIKISQSIDDGTFKGDQEYAKRYSNETMFEFYKRWDHIINKLKNIRYQLDWEEEHLVIYISC